MAAVSPRPDLHATRNSHHHLMVSSTLPSEVVACLRNARFLHLATCDGLFPHVSLMNYTYLPASPYTSHPTVIMTTDPSSKKTHNLIRNPRVALLVHDWVSHRPPSSTTADPDRAVSPAEQAPRSSLANLLLNLNTSALSSISATINGTARLIEAGTEEERYFKQKHLENNTFGDQARQERDDPGRGPEDYEGDGGRNCYIESDRVRVVAVRVVDGRIADWKGGVKNWALDDVDGEPHAPDGGAQDANGIPNGIS